MASRSLSCKCYFPNRGVLPLPVMVTLAHVEQQLPPTNHLTGTKQQPQYLSNGARPAQQPPFCGEVQQEEDWRYGIYSSPQHCQDHEALHVAVCQYLQCQTHNQQCSDTTCVYKATVLPDFAGWLAAPWHWQDTQQVACTCMCDRHSHVKLKTLRMQKSNTVS